MCRVQKVQIRNNDDLIGFINRYMRGGLYERLHKGSLSSSSKKVAVSITHKALACTTHG